MSLMKLAHVAKSWIVSQGYMSCLNFPCFKSYLVFLKAVVQREGNKLKVNLKGIESVTELVDGNTIVNVSNNAHNFTNSVVSLDWF